MRLAAGVLVSFLLAGAARAGDSAGQLARLYDETVAGQQSGPLHWGALLEAGGPGLLISAARARRVASIPQASAELDRASTLEPRGPARADLSSAYNILIARSSLHQAVLSDLLRDLSARDRLIARADEALGRVSARVRKLGSLLSHEEAGLLDALQANRYLGEAGTRDSALKLTRALVASDFGGLARRVLELAKRSETHARQLSEARISLHPDLALPRSFRDWRGTSSLSRSLFEHSRFKPPTRARGPAKKAKH
jgi:hypothetical protein